MPHQCTNCGRTFDDGSKEMLSGCPDCDGTTFQFSPGGFDDAPETPPDPPERPDDGMARTVGNAAATVRDLVSGSADPDATRATPPDDPDSPDGPDGPGGSAGTADAGDATSADSDSAGDPDDIIVAESGPSGEDAVQADARSQFAGPDDLPGSDGSDDPGPASDEGNAGAGDDSAAPNADSVAEGDADEGDDRDERDGRSDDGRTVVSEPDTTTADRPDLAQLREELNEQFESIRIVERGQYELNLMELYDRDEVIVALGEDGRYSIRVPEAIGEADV